MLKTKKKKIKTKQDLNDVFHAYDLALKRIFSHPDMIESLIRGFVPGAWVTDLDLDFAKLKKVNVAYVAEELRSRENDIIWQIEFRGQPLYLIFLLEFQSSIDKYMAVRLLAHVGLVYQDILIQKKLPKEGTLPPVFSLVFYTGFKAWDAPTHLKQCYSAHIPEGLMEFQPHIKYMVLDVGRVPLDEYSKIKDNLVLPLIELENVSSPNELKLINDKLVELLKDKKFDKLRKDFLIYIKRAAKLPQRFPEIEIHKLHEVGMLSERLDMYDQKLRHEGRQEGRQEGHQEGRQEGRQEERRKTIYKMLSNEYPSGIPQNLQKKLKVASFEELDQWFDQLLASSYQINKKI